MSKRTKRAGYLYRQMSIIRISCVFFDHLKHNVLVLHSIPILLWESLIFKSFYLVMENFFFCQFVVSNQFKKSSYLITADSCNC